MIYMKHAERGNKHFPVSEEEARLAEGWVKWPRTKEQKAGVAPVPPADPVATEAVKRKPGRPRKESL